MSAKAYNPDSYYVPETMSNTRYRNNGKPRWWVMVHSIENNNDGNFMPIPPVRGDQHVSVPWRTLAMVRKYDLHVWVTIGVGPQNQAGIRHRLKIRSEKYLYGVFDSNLHVLEWMLKKRPEPKEVLDHLVGLYGVDQGTNVFNAFCEYPVFSHPSRLMNALRYGARHQELRLEENARESEDLQQAAKEAVDKRLEWLRSEEAQKQLAGLKAYAQRMMHKGGDLYQSAADRLEREIQDAYALAMN